MMKLSGCTIVLSGLIFLVGCDAVPVDTTPPVTEFSADLTGDSEVPPTDSVTIGLARVALTADGLGLEFLVQLENATGVTQAHIHVGAADENGPVVAFLFGVVEAGVSGNGDLSAGTLTAGDLIGDLEGMTINDLMDEIRSGNAYVNVHSLDNPTGEVRGQLGPFGG